MKKITSKWKESALLLIVLATGWLVYHSFQRPVSFRDQISPEQILNPERQLIISGIVEKYDSNHEGDIDKIVLVTKSKKVWLHFPPHTARQVTAIAEIDHSIEATVHRKNLPGRDSEDVYELKYLRGESPETTLDLARIPAPFPRKGFEVEIKGNIPDDLKTKSGDDFNFILSGKLISLPPHMARELLPLIRQAKTILVRGQMRDSTEGFLSASGLKVVKPNSIQIDSITYKIR